MQKTANYSLNQWEPHDEIKVEDFNADNAAIDTALESLTSMAETLNTGLAAKGNCSVVCSTYTGTGTYGSNGKNKLSFNGKPLAVFLIGSSYNGMLIRSSAVGYFFDNSSYKRSQTVTWGENSVSWYSDSSSNQMNNMNTYYYVALLT